MFLQKRKGGTERGKGSGRCARRGSARTGRLWTEPAAAFHRALPEPLGGRPAIRTPARHAAIQDEKARNPPCAAGRRRM